MPTIHIYICFVVMLHAVHGAAASQVMKEHMIYGMKHQLCVCTIRQVPIRLEKECLHHSILCTRFFWTCGNGGTPEQLSNWPADDGVYNASVEAAGGCKRSTG